ncbi:hypothetical protein KUCAC02_017807 [Chaenocephalus aceratus]|uniref:Uncharacterized protein n=1 Tax=Chaenocephalus aceratus TaxID=36190 RepID=A0ACB9W359_CHAAC|nr:hypothetical protein KUCAC02_017807 [Chaenocephalus aceratus]
MHLCYFEDVIKIDAAQTPIKRSLPALNLPAVLPRALEMEKGRLGVKILRVLIQRNPTAVLFLITHEPRVCANPLHNSTPQPQALHTKPICFSYQCTCQQLGSPSPACRGQEDNME